MPNSPDRRRPEGRCASSCALLAFSIFLAGCGGAPRDAARLFELLDARQTGIDFVNELEYAYEFNIYRYRNFYNGGGVALGDVNNDGLLDVFLVGNQVPNKLYLNDGGFAFTDVTAKAGLAGRRAWSTGISMADVNGDGWLDVYVCNSGIVEGDDKKNELYINNGDTTFTESAEAYGIADGGLSIHGSFFDYDRDGDLDLYLVNNSYRNIGSFNLQDNTRHIRHRSGGDRLYRNVAGGSPPDPAPGQDATSRIASLSPGSAPPYPPETPSFVDVSAEAGIYGSEIGFGLGVSVGDVNRDGWSDIYVSNDFFERDYLYLNNHDGTFVETLEQSIRSVSAAAMGADMADLNNDGYLEVFVTDMLPYEERRIKLVTSFDTWERYQNYIRDDYYHQFTRNTLHLNRGTPTARGWNATAPPVYFSEVGRMSGVEASDWSWGAMIADFDLDGFRDLFVANGIYQDLTNADFLVKITDERTMNELIQGNYVDFERLIDMIPSNPISNHVFAGRSDVRFAEVTEDWGLSQPGFSNGSVYGDLDNDGDLDLVVNNVNMEPFVYRNRATDVYPDRAWIRIELEGPSPNTFGVGAQVTAWAGGRQWYVEQQPVRGFQSTVDHTLHVGLGSELPAGRLDSLVVRWPDGRAQTLVDVAANQRLTLEHAEATPASAPRRGGMRADGPPLLVPVDAADLGLTWRHRENVFNDFARQPLLFHMRSTEGPALCVGDANGDALSDVYLGGARDQPGAVFIQTQSGRFRETPQPALERDRISEDTDCTWFDADGDGDLDLYAASGGSEFPASSSALMDRLYFNDGAGRLERSDQLMISAASGFEPTGTVAATDVDADGDVDLFVGARMIPFAHGVPADGHLLLNDGNGRFDEVTDTQAPELRDLGLVTGSKWGDVDGDGDPDLVVVGEWMPLTVFENESGRLTRTTGLEATTGWWNAVELADIDGDGDLDLIGANHGLNSRFTASPEEPMQMWVDDFDGNGTVEQVLAIHREGKVYPMALRHDLIDQLPYLEDVYPTYESFAGRTVHDVFSDEQLDEAIHLEAVELRTVVGWNDGQGRFRIESLPDEAQLAPMFGVAVDDLDGDGQSEVLLGGNFYEAKPQVGRYDASFGVALTAGDDGLQPVPLARSGFWVTGQVRRLGIVPSDSRNLLLVARNNDSLNVFTYGD